MSPVAYGLVIRRDDGAVLRSPLGPTIAGPEAASPQAAQAKVAQPALECSRRVRGVRWQRVLVVRPEPRYAERCKPVVLRHRHHHDSDERA